MPRSGSAWSRGVVVDEEAGVKYRYLALYEIEGDPQQLLAAMAERQLGTRDS